MEQNFLDFIDHHIDRVADLTRDACEAAWTRTLSSALDFDDVVEEHRKNLTKIYSDRELYARVRAYDEEQFSSDPVTLRQLHIMRLTYAQHQMPPEVAERLAEEEAGANRIVRSFRPRIDGEIATANEISEILHKERDGGARQEAWLAARQIGEEVGPTLLRVVGIRNRAARDLGFRDYYNMTLEGQEIDEPMLIGLLDDITEKTHDPYFHMKSELDSELAGRFGGKVKDLMPWHYSDPFMEEAPPHRESNLDHYYEDVNVEHLAERFFRGIGLDIRDVLHNSDLRPREGRRQPSFCMHVDPRIGDIRIYADQRNTEKCMSNLLRLGGKAAYLKYLGEDLPYLLRRAAHPLCLEAVGLLLGQQSRSSTFLARFLGANKSVASRTTNQLARQDRVSGLIMARWIPVMVHFERALYEDPGQDLNRLWWDLVTQHQGLNCPDENTLHFAWAGKLELLQRPVQFHNHLLGQLVACQLRSTMQNQAGIREMVDEEEVGAWLKNNLFDIGAHHPWNETLKITTGETLTSRFFLEEILD